MLKEEYIANMINMSEENQEPVVEEAQEQEVAPQEMNTEQCFNLLVNLARQSKLNYDEHALVDRAVKKLAEKLSV